MQNLPEPEPQPDSRSCGVLGRPWCWVRRSLTDAGLGVQGRMEGKPRHTCWLEGDGQRREDPVKSRGTHPATKHLPGVSQSPLPHTQHDTGNWHLSKERMRAWRACDL